MKRMMAMLLVIALFTASFPVSVFAESRIEYSPVEAVISKTENLEQSYREWAADIINRYYHHYAMHSDSYSAKYEDFEFDRNFWDQYQGDYVFQFDGIYRGYYMASIIKEEFDFNEAKSDYTVVMPDANSAEWKAQQKEFYMLLLAETINEKLAIDPNAFDEVEVDQKGMYTMQLDPATGMMKMVYDENGVMGNLEEIANEQVEQAVTSLIIDTAEFGVSAVYGYFDAKKELANAGSQKQDSIDFMDTLVEGCITGCAAVFERVNSTVHQNEINKIQNQIMGIHQTYIANSMLSGSQRIIGYLERVYAGNDPSFTKLLSDPLFLEAVNDLIEWIDQNKNIESEAEAQKVVEEWYSSSGINLKEELSVEDILAICAMEICSQALKLSIDLIQKITVEIMTCGDEKTVATWQKVISGLGDAILSCCEPLVTKYATAFIDYVAKTGSIPSPSQLQVDIKRADIIKNIAGELTSVLEALSKDSIYATAVTGVWSVLNAILWDMLDLIEKSDGEFTEHDWQELCKLLNSLIDAIWKAVYSANKDDILSRVVKFDPSEYSAENGEEALVQKLRENAKLKKMIELGIQLKDKALDVSKSGANLAYVLMNDVKDEKQDSYRAKAMYSAYDASHPVEKDLESSIVLLTNNQTNDLAAVVMDPASSLQEIKNITDKIQLQVEYDLVGTRWLIEILGLNEKAGWFTDSEYFEFLKDSTKDTSWAGELTLDTASHRYDDMFGFNGSLRTKWRSAFDLLY